jgi:hypothetical protein
MRKASRRDRDGLRGEYDPSVIRRGVRGKYADRYRRGTNLVLLEPDVATAFPTTKSVNEALRLLIKIAGTLPKPTAR